MVYKNFIDHRKKLLQLHFLKLKSISEKHCKLQKKKKNMSDMSSIRN